MIAVRCKTNLDAYLHEVWPMVFPCKPAVGEYVRSKSGKSLKIHTITYTAPYLHDEPVLEIELHN